MLLNKRYLYTGLLILYFLLVFFIEEVNSNIIVIALFYMVFFGGIFAKILMSRNNAPLTAIYIFGAIMLVFAGYFVNGNISILSVFYIVFGIIWAMLFLDPNVDSNHFSRLVIINAVLISFLIFRYGARNQLFPKHSNNYVSVYLLIPLCLYYCRKDLYNEEYAMYPAILVLVLSVIAGGRGGFLASAIIVIPVILCKFFSKKRSLGEKLILVLFLLVSATVVLFPLFKIFIENNSDLGLVRQFSAKAMTSYYRLYCWKEYIQSTFKDPLYFLFGSDLEKLYWVQVLDGNLHNSFLFIHAYTGILGLLFVVIIGIRSVKYAINNKKWLYLFSLLAFVFRGLTDHVFGANRVTPVFLALLMAPVILRTFDQEVLLRLKHSKITIKLVKTI